MRCLLVIALCVLVAVLAAPPHEKGLIINLDNGELCAISMQCKSSCCHRSSGISLARCAPQAAENQECSKKTLYGTYYRCTCESGLKCKGDISIGGSITNTNFGICVDPNSKEASAN
ncbi:colipase-like isoform X1 [Megalops cyprinoides]|uniref:colipase-like isoform X1 n=1 Tax=Megalops cyprinoides TaxID=118141 RepID=UPI001864D1AE|nr:colipase-like isoform X1 [Megalops cyprinoides]